MICTYSNLCRICKVRIPAKTDVHYDGKAIAHWDCLDQEKPGPDAFRLADELGFVGPEDVVPTETWRTWKGKAQPENGKLF